MTGIDMKNFIGIAALLSCSACFSSSDFKPTDDEVAKIETALQRHRCVGALDGWRRSYSRMPVFATADFDAGGQGDELRHPDRFDKRIVELRLERADGRSIMPGRRDLKSYDDFALMECREPGCLGGGYMIQRDELAIECGKR